MHRIILALALMATVSVAGLTYYDNVTLIGTDDGVNYYDLSGGDSGWTDTNAPIAMWEMNETNTTQTLDTSQYAGGLGSGYHANNKLSVAAGPAQTIVGTNEFGRVENGYTFNGVNTYFQCPSEFINAVSNDTVGSINLWVNLAVDDGNIHEFFTFNSGAIETYILFFADFGVGDDFLRVTIKADSVIQSSYRTASDFTDALVGSNTMITLTQNGVAPKMSVNGVDVALTDAGGSNDGVWLKGLTDATTPPTICSIGALDFSSLLQVLNGTIGEIEYYNYVLSTNQITDLYNNTNPTNNVRIR